jgi:hypothetical protein
MSKATFNLARPVTVSKLDTTGWSRELWNAAHAMARRMIRDRAGHGIGAAWTWYLQHARRRFTTPTGWRIAQAAGHAVFDRRTVGYAASGSVADLERQGLVRRTRRPRPGNLTATVAYRCASFERLRDCGLNMAWTHDPLASSSNKGLRVYRAQRRREVARAMAQDRAAMERSRFGLTVVGVLALRTAEAARATA